jgi:NAD(P)-dependent dehydrogenase (short-subunit alcohol dehydrogenase family)
MTEFDFKGRKILVTGASRGIGEAIAHGFAAAGGEVTIMAEDDGVAATAQRIARETGRPVAALRCDIADETAVRGAVANLKSLDVLINNAGYQPRTPFADPSPAVDREFRRVIEVNVLGTYFVTRHALPLMGRGGRILLTSSIWGKTGAAEYSGYCASKHAVLGFMRSLALELGPRGITVNAVCPGWVETEGAMWTVRQIAMETGRRPADLIEDYLRFQPIPGMMAPRDLAATYLFLASEGAADITGQALNVDRGHFIG